MPWEIPKKISLLAVAILFLFTFFNLILDAPRKVQVHSLFNVHGLRLNSQKGKICSLVSGFSTDFSTLGPAYGFLSQNPRYIFAIHKTPGKSLRILI